MATEANTNLAARTGDRWRPQPLLPGDRSGVGHWKGVARRFFDLQSGSIAAAVVDHVSSWRGKVVDVGCGAQPYRALLAPDVEYVGLDIAESDAQFGYSTQGTVYFDGGAWPAEVQNADHVLCTETLEHVLDPAAFLAEASAALRPGGTLLLTVPFAARWHFVPFDYWRFTPSSLQHLLQRAGFSDITVTARGNELTVACYKTMALFLPFYFPQNSSPAKIWARRLLALPGLPLFVGLAAVANLSLRRPGADDCLGYTATARRAPD